MSNPLNLKQMGTSKIKDFIAMYAMQVISEEQLREVCDNDATFKQALKEASDYSDAYKDYLDGLERAKEFGLVAEYNYCVFHLNMSPAEACDEWDI